MIAKSITTIRLNICTFNVAIEQRPQKYFWDVFSCLLRPDESVISKQNGYAKF